MTGPVGQLFGLDVVMWEYRSSSGKGRRGQCWRVRVIQVHVSVVKGLPTDDVPDNYSDRSRVLCEGRSCRSSGMFTSGCRETLPLAGSSQASSTSEFV